MEDTRLRIAFVKLCRHLNVKLRDNYYGFGHEGVFVDYDCKLMRKSDFKNLQGQIYSLQQEVECLKSKKKKKKR